MPIHHTKHHFPVPHYKHTEDKLKEIQKEKLDAQTILLLIVHGLFAAANALSGTFVNVYLWKVSNELALIGWFALSFQIANVITVWVAGKWVKERNKMNSLRLGVALSALFYVLVLFLQKQAVDYVFVLGLVQGTAAGFFWLAFNVIYFEVTGPNNRDKFNGWAGLLGSGAGMVAPWISGFLITQMTDMKGYRLIFAISLGIFLIGVAVSFFLRKREVSGSYEWFYAFKNLKNKQSPWRSAIPALTAQGIREGVFAFIIGLLVYIVTNNELQVGNFALITSAVALVSFWLAGKYLKPKYRNISMLVGTLAIILSVFPFFWKVNYTTLLIFGIGTAIFFPLFTIPMISSVFDIIGKDNNSAEHRVEFVVLRELGLSAGRMLGIVLFIVVTSWSMDQQVLNILLLIIGSSPIVAWFYMRKLFKSE